jgi:hypothetical protein
MENENEIFGNLFGSINLISEDHLEILLSTMDNNTANYYLIEAIKSAYKKGAFSIGESEVISKAIRILLKNTDDK